MGSLNNGRPPRQDGTTVKTNGNIIQLRNINRDNVMAQKFFPDLNKTLVDNENTMRGMLGRILWLDADDESTISLSGVTVTRWADKTSNGIFTQASGEYGNQRRPTYSSNTVNVGYTQRNCILTNGGQGFTLGQLLDGSLVGPGKKWTSVLAAKPTTFNNDDSFMEVVTKYGVNADDLGFTFYIYDSTNKKYRSEFYNAGLLNDGCNVSSISNIEVNKPYVFTNVYSATSGVNSARFKQNINRELENGSEFIFGGGLTGDIVDNDVPLCLGFSYDAANYSGFIGGIYEWLVFNRVLTDREIAAVENYLAIKWGITPYVPKLRAGVNSV